MKIDNLNKLIDRLSTLPPHRFYIKHICGTVCCISGWSNNFFGEYAGGWLGFDHTDEGRLYERLIMPPGWDKFPERYPLDRAIATLKRLRDTYLSTGQVVVDWGPEPGEEPKQAWTAPQVAEVINPALPAELTSLLRNTVEA